jgi:hypothetical protein
MYEVNYEDAVYITLLGLVLSALVYAISHFSWRPL